MAKNDRTGRSRNARIPWEQCHVQLINAFRQEPAWRALTFGARSAYVEVKALYNGSNNGSIMCSVRHLAKKLGCVNGSAERWLRELEEHGFLVKMQIGWKGAEGGGVGTTWRLTELGHMGEQPTREYRQWQSKTKSPSLKSGRGVSKMRTLSARGVSKMRTGCPENEDTSGRIRGVGCPENEDDLVIYQGEAPKPPPMGDWQPGFEHRGRVPDPAEAPARAAGGSPASSTSAAITGVTAIFTGRHG